MTGKNLIRLKDHTCDFCGTCVGVCPENCIELLETSLSIDHELCTRCQKCILICPVNALFLEPES